MDFFKSKVKDYYLNDTRLENLFISEYLPAAPGDYVKVFVYGLMHAEHGIPVTDKEMAERLGISVKDVEKAWSYWEKYGVIKKRYIDSDGKVDFGVEFLDLRELMYGKNKGPGPREEAPETNIFGSEEVRKVFEEIEAMMGRNLSSTELTEVIGWMEDDNIAPDVVLYGFSYSLEKNKSSIKYIDKVVHSWNEDGYYTVDQVREHLADVDNRFYEYKRVMTALGMNRIPTEGEKKMMDGWFDTYGFNMDKVLEACDKTVGITTPTFSYVNKVLENWANEADKRGASVNSRSVSQSKLTRYYAYLREKAEKEAEEEAEAAEDADEEADDSGETESEEDGE